MAIFFLKYKKLISSFLLFSIVFLCGFALNTERVSAVGTGSVVETIEIFNIKEYTIDTVAKIAANLLLGTMTQSIVNWINTGFEGNPTFIEDPEQFFTDMAMNASGLFLTELGLDNSPLCKGFRPNILLGLGLYNNYSFNQKAKCTLGTVEENLTGFYDDFYDGGWERWLSVSKPENNAYGSFLIALNEMERRKARAASTARDEVNWGSGFFSIKECIEKDAAGKCIKQKSVTPGKVIGDKLAHSLGAGEETLIAADELSETIAAILSALVNQLINQGLSHMR